MMATGTQLVQLASFFDGTDARTQTSRNDITCVDANRHGDLFAVGVHKRIKVCLHGLYAIITHLLCHRFTVIRILCCVVLLAFTFHLLISI